MFALNSRASQSTYWIVSDMCVKILPHVQSLRSNVAAAKHTISGKQWTPLEAIPNRLAFCCEISCMQCMTYIKSICTDAAHAVLAGRYVTADEVWAVKERCAATIQRFTRGWLARIRYICIAMILKIASRCLHCIRSSPEKSDGGAGYGSC